MEKINPPEIEAQILKAGKINTTKTLSELGISSPRCF